MWWNGASRFEFIGTLMNTEIRTWSEFPNGGKATVEQILALEEINKFKSPFEPPYLKRFSSCVLNIYLTRESKTVKAHVLKELNVDVIKYFSRFENSMSSEN